MGNCFKIIYGKLYSKQSTLPLTSPIDGGRTQTAAFGGGGSDVLVRVAGPLEFHLERLRRQATSHQVLGETHFERILLLLLRCVHERAIDVDLKR